ncbi:DNA-3-methyladenine glycosylase 2 family protein [Xylophilus sp. ASV27]|uniref:DNA-3-methyladenine glycosylase 2 family protein n=1 Tax=Xylophilus sp. ASV27 TaxID=2795129 RepID=UPI0018EBFC25|nr:Ada metal-binding domain-containing protein [Xylophilus sp. ASV27]
MRPAAPPPDADACYRALLARDARFDGRFFTAVTSTGIYCRPVCRVRTPLRANCRFFLHAAQAEQAGFRPCLRCRPELAPADVAWSTQDAAAILAQEAARRLDDPACWRADGAAQGTPVARLAARLGISDRHLRRVFEAQFGVSPLQYLQTRRLLAAKQLLTDTALPVAGVAEASGFGSLRRLQAAFGSRYGLSPAALRRAGATGGGTGGAVVRLAYRPPYAVEGTLEFLRRRALAGVEAVQGAADGAGPRFVRALAVGGSAGWLQLHFDPERCHAVLRVSDTLCPALPALIRQVRAWFDLDADPAAIDAVLQPHFPGMEGWRVPGGASGFELAVRAVLGQQITVAAARTLGSRLVRRFGTPVATPFEGIDRLFPTPEVLATAEGDALGALGIVRQRQVAIVALARAVAEGHLALEPGSPPAPAVARLLTLPGIGDWTAQYIAMRALRWPDAFPAGDVALQQALGVRGLPHPARAAQAASQAWRPWRSYAVLRAWHAPPAPRNAT